MSEEENSQEASEESSREEGEKEGFTSDNNAGNFTSSAESKQRINLIRQQGLFVNAKSLEEKLTSAMSKYGLAKMDVDVAQLISETIKLKLSETIEKLVEISRNSQNTLYIQHKGLAPGEMFNVTTYNVSIKDQLKNREQVQQTLENSNPP